MKKYYFYQLLETSEINVGTQEIEETRLKAQTSTRLDKGKEPNEESMIMGVPMEYLDLIKNIISLSPAKKVQNSETYKEGFRQQEEYNFYVGFDFEFKIQTYIFVYFSAVDVISERGCIGATIKIALAAIAPLMVLKFM